MDIKNKINFSAFLLLIEAHLKFILFAVLLSVFTLSSYPFPTSIYHDYSVGDVVRRDIKAPMDLCIEDGTNINLSAHQSLLGVPLVYDFDLSVQSYIVNRIENIFRRHRNLQHKVELYGLEVDEDLSDDKNTLLCFDEGFSLRKKIFTEEIGINVSDSMYIFFVKHRFNKYIPELINSIIAHILSNGIVFDYEKRVWDLKVFYGLEQARDMLRTIEAPLLEDLDYVLLNLLLDFSQKLIEPNIVPNLDETNRSRSLGIELTTPEFLFVKSGEMILREGEIVNENDLLKLKVLDDETGNSWSLSIGNLLILTLVLIVYYGVQLKPKIEADKIGAKDLVLVTTILVISMMVARIWPNLPNIWYFALPVTEGCLSSLKFGVPLAAGSMIVCLVIGIETAFPFAFLLAGIVSMLFLDRFEHLVYFSLSGAVAVWWVKDCREREAIIKAGAKIGLFCGLISIVFNVGLLGFFQWYAFIFDSIVAFLSGIIAGVVVVGVLPLIELMFRYTTDSTLSELANLDRPILRRLMLEAPGTYHHSVVVGLMVEAAASEIGANSLLGKVCGYYHDIGKLKQPLYFVENQLTHRNRHDKLSPFMSSLILISHVKHGIEVAKKHNLGSAIVDVIRQHHGNRLISYFFEKS